MPTDSPDPTSHTYHPVTASHGTPEHEQQMRRQRGEMCDRMLQMWVLRIPIGWLSAVLFAGVLAGWWQGRVELADPLILLWARHLAATAIFGGLQPFLPRWDREVATA